MQEDEHRLLRLLNALRNTHPDMEWLFTHGQCYNLWRIVRTVFPDARCMYSAIEGHIYIEYKSRFYDIRGRHARPPADLELLDHKSGDRPHRWSLRSSIEHRLTDTG